MALAMIMLAAFREDAVLKVAVVCLTPLLCCRAGWACGRDKIWLRVGVLKSDESGLET